MFVVPNEESEIMIRSHSRRIGQRDVGDRQPAAACEGEELWRPHCTWRITAGPASFGAAVVEPTRWVGPVGRRPTCPAIPVDGPVGTSYAHVDYVVRGDERINHQQAWLRPTVAEGWQHVGCSIIAPALRAHESRATFEVQLRVRWQHDGGELKNRISRYRHSRTVCQRLLYCHRIPDGVGRVVSRHGSVCDNRARAVASALFC